MTWRDVSWREIRFDLSTECTETVSHASSFPATSPLHYWPGKLTVSGVEIREPSDNNTGTSACWRLLCAIYFFCYSIIRWSIHTWVMRRGREPTAVVSFLQRAGMMEIRSSGHSYRSYATLDLEIVIAPVKWSSFRSISWPTGKTVSLTLLQERDVLRSKSEGGVPLFSSPLHLLLANNLSILQHTPPTKIKEKTQFCPDILPEQYLK